MTETKIEWNGKNGRVVEDGTIEVALLAATEEAKPFVEKLYEIANRYGVSIHASTSDMRRLDGKICKYVSVDADYTLNNVRHFISQTKMGPRGSYDICKYVWMPDDDKEPYEDSPCEIRTCG